MDLNDLRSAITLAGLLVFVGIVLWAWSRGRRDAFDAAAQLPFIDESAPARRGERA